MSTTGVVIWAFGPEVSVAVANATAHHLAVMADGIATSSFSFALAASFGTFAKEADSGVFIPLGKEGEASLALSFALTAFTFAALAHESARLARWLSHMGSPAVFSDLIRPEQALCDLLGRCPWKSFS